jgi:GNAT superfamily N-acetyltransferase
VLSKAGRKPPPELTFEQMGSPDGTPTCDLETAFSGYLKMWPRVDGHRVANVWGHPIWLYFPQHTPTLTYEVDWVHTAARWRRRGLSRQTMAAFLAHPLGDCCGSMMLGTGTRNVAHAMYRSFGFVDVTRGAQYKRTPTADVAPVAERVSFRPYKEGDGAAASKLIRTWFDQFLHDHRWTCQDSERPVGNWIRVAERDGEMVGLIEAERWEEELGIQMLCVAPGDDQQQIAQSLLAMAQREAFERKCKHVAWYWALTADVVGRALQQQGFARTEDGGVWMWGVRDLPLLLSELRPLFEHRLRESECQDWNGRIDLRSPSHRARLAVEDGRVSVLKAQRGTPELSLESPDTILNTILMGRQTPFEAYLQTDMAIQPRVSDRVTKLLETLFPTMPMA